MGRWVWGAIRRSGRPSGLVLVYDPRYVVHLPSIPMDPLRSEMVLAFLTDEGLVRRRELMRPQSASMKNLRRVHSDKYLESLERREVVEQIVGAPLSDEQAQGLVEFQRLAAGGTVLAAVTALRTGLGGGQSRRRVSSCGRKPGHGLLRPQRPGDCGGPGARTRIHRADSDR